MSALTGDQSSSIFMGQVTRRNGVGGPDAPVELHIDEDLKSGASMIFKKLVFGGGDFAANATLNKVPGIPYL